MPALFPAAMLPALIIATALFMENMDATVIATSLPAIAADLGVDPIALKLALTSYLVSVAVFIPISGWMADRFGTRTMFRWAIVVFIAGSIWCAFSGSLTTFVLARFLQGMGGAMMVPVGKLVLLRTTEKSELVRTMSYLTIPALLGPVMGPPLGGFISTYFHWRWIFLINIPIGLLGLWLSGRYIAQLRADKPVPLDVTGFLLCGGGLSLAMLGMASGGKHLLTPFWAYTLTAVGFGLLAAYLWHYTRSQHPLMDLSLLKIPTFNASVLGGFAFRVGMGATPFLVPLMLQLGFGMTPFQSGLLTCSTALGAIFMKTMVQRLLGRWGYRRVLLVNSVLCSLSFAAYGLFTATTPVWLMLATFLLGGLLRSLQFTSLNTLAYADMPQSGMSHATTLSSVLMQLASGLGVTIAAFVLLGISQWQGHASVQASDFAWSFVVMALLAMSSTWQLRGLAKDAGAALAVKRA